ncbi:uncharacterized protein I303_106102 [Kwoniella dejecticola CBS 10117]|uniref:Chromosome transmission fidelity protein 8 n=1 Tax=Kwoniella dejecticola CBS 10117 TaxID=1296121 RepID=A0A1A6A1A1_9TREE|nr:chromosome transmission fidelity protein 8 [Kwoniella dejecticola CBS 10117]OBR83838.1 chromosome transmission fidelity protein 8 [Kwoniella dejecticola CBS 10117]
MRIHLPLHPSQFDPPSASSSSSPLIQLGGDLVLVELQGELTYEGDKSDGVIGVIGLDRPDKPTLHLGAHHLLHGKFQTLQKPYAVIRKVVGNAIPGTIDPKAKNTETTTILEGDALDEESDNQDAGHAEDAEDEEEEEEEGPLFPKSDEIGIPVTPAKRRRVGDKLGERGDGLMINPVSSSPFSEYQAPLTPMDYSSELDMSSPARSVDDFDKTEDEDEDEEEEEDGKRPSKRSKNGNKIRPMGMSRKERRQKEKKLRLRAGEKEKEKERDRVRSYAVVGIVKKKLVFALRPEPLVAPTILPE